MFPPGLSLTTYTTGTNQPDSVSTARTRAHISELDAFWLLAVYTDAQEVASAHAFWLSSGVPSSLMTLFVHVSTTVPSTPVVRMRWNCVVPVGFVRLRGRLVKHLCKFVWTLRVRDTSTTLSTSYGQVLVFPDLMHTVTASGY